jgi:hypothetical protein
MKRETLKYIGLGLIAVVLLAANINMVYKTFFAKNRLNLDLKQPANITNAEIQHYADSLFTHKDSLTILEDDIMSNKRIIVSRRDGFPENGDTLGFVFIIYESIPCPSCSDVNCVMFTDRKYTIRDVRYIRDVIEDYKTIPEEYINAIIVQVIGKNVMQDDLMIVIPEKSPKKQSNGFSASIVELQSRVRLLK